MAAPQHWVIVLLYGASSLCIPLSIDAFSLKAFRDVELLGDSECEFDEIQLASDGTIGQWGLGLGTRVASNMSVNGSVTPDGYNFYHLCVGRQKHEHLILVELLCDTEDVTKGGDANLYLSSEVTYPRMGHSTWIAQRHGNELIKLYTYLDGFPRNDEKGGRRWLALHIGVFGAGQVTTNYALSISVSDLLETPDLLSRKEFYTKQHNLDRKPRLRQR